MEKKKAVLTITSSTQPQRLTKLWEICAGTPKKQGAGMMSEGTVTRASASTPEEMAAVLLGLQSNQDRKSVV